LSTPVWVALTSKLGLCTALGVVDSAGLCHNRTREYSRWYPSTSLAWPPLPLCPRQARVHPQPIDGASMALRRSCVYSECSTGSSAGGRCLLIAQSLRLQLLLQCVSSTAVRRAARLVVALQSAAHGMQWYSSVLRQSSLGIAIMPTVCSALYRLIVARRNAKTPQGLYRGTLGTIGVLWVPSGYSGYYRGARRAALIRWRGTAEG
jgi:hypothetical protein